jgi:putative transposase
MGFGEFSRQLQYKSAIYSTNLIIADRWFPSSKTCSGCGNIKQDLTLRDRTYECNSCGILIDRDLNAAINLLTLGLSEHAHGRLNNPKQSDLTGAESVEVRTNQCPQVGTI